MDGSGAAGRQDGTGRPRRNSSGIDLGRPHPGSAPVAQQRSRVVLAAMGSDVCLELSHAVLAARPPGQDRVAVIPAGSGFVLALADGSGGLRGGAEAAERSLQLIADDVRAGGGRREPAAWSSLL